MKISKRILNEIGAFFPRDVPGNDLGDYVPDEKPKKGDIVFAKDVRSYDSDNAFFYLEGDWDKGWPKASRMAFLAKNIHQFRGPKYLSVDAPFLVPRHDHEENPVYVKGWGPKTMLKKFDAGKVKSMLRQAGVQNKFLSGDVWVIPTPGLDPELLRM